MVGVIAMRGWLFIGETWVLMAKVSIFFLDSLVIAMESRFHREFAIVWHVQNTCRTSCRWAKPSQACQVDQAPVAFTDST